MAIDVGEIVATLRANTEPFSDGLQKANKSMDEMRKKFEGAGLKFNETGMTMVQMGGKMTMAAGAVGALAAAAAKEFGSFAEEIEMISQKTGVSSQSLQKWGFALNRVGLGVEDLVPGFKKLSDVASKAFSGDDKARIKIERLGVSLSDLKKQNPEEIFLTLAGAIAKISDPITRNAAGSDIFGKAFLKLVPILGEVATGFEASGKRAEELGLVFKGEALSSASALDDSFDDLTATMAGFSRTIGSTFSGPLKDVVDALTQSLGAFNVWWQGLDAGTKKIALIFAATFAASGPIIAVIGAFMVAVTAGLGPLLVGGAIVAGVVAGVASIVANWESMKAKVVAIWTGFKDSVVTIAMQTYEGIKKYFTDKLMAIVQPVQKFGEDVLNIFKKLRYEVVGGSEVPDMVKEIGDHMRMLDKNMTAPARVAAQGTWDVFRDLAGKMDGTSKQIATTVVSVWTSASSTMANALATQIIKGNDWKATMESIATTALSSFINLGIQMATQHAMQLGMWAAKNAVILAGELATATGVLGIWTGASAAIAGVFGTLTGVIMGFFTATILPFFAAIGTALMTFLSAIAAAASATIFGIPYGVAILAGVAIIGAAIGGLMAFGAFAEGGVVTKPMMGLVGEAGPEAIIPLSKLDTMMGGGGRQTLIVKLDGRTLARSTFDNMPGVMNIRGVRT